MTLHSRIGRLAPVFACVTILACAPHHFGQAAQPAGETTSDYEVYNPTPCVAIASTVDQATLDKTELARVPSGSRVIIRVPSLHQGVRLVATATAPDGSDCERGYQIAVRRLTP
jgi:hypothetical protein